MPSQEIEVDLTIIGAGVTGLLIAFKASSIGIRTAVVERDHLVASGPSTRNEGWLHHGSYHASSVRNEAEALAVAARCMYGHRQIRAYAPEAVESPSTRSFALVRSRDFREHAVERWMRAGVPFREVPFEELRRIEPRLRLEGAYAAFEVSDVSINTRILYRKLLTQALVAGAKIFRSAEIESVKDKSLELLIAGERRRISSSLLVYSTGFGLKDLFRRLYNIDLKLRFWKSHLLITDRLSEHAAFFLEPGEAAMMHHTERSIIGLNEDAMLREEPDFQTNPECVERLREALSRLVNAPCDLWSSIACIKVDFERTGTQQSAGRSVNVFYREELPGHIWVLPGKMTEAPYIADEILRIIEKRLPGDFIASRPCDQISFTERT